MQEYQIELTNTSPLLMHADDVEAADRLKEWRQSPVNKNVSVAGDDRSPAWTWQTYLYHADGNLCIPAANFMTCLRQAGTKKIMKKQTTYKEITQSSIFCSSDNLEFFDNGKKIPLTAIKAIDFDTFPEHMAAAKKLGFELFCKRATIGKAKHVRVRPRFNNWSVRLSLSVTAQEITKPILQELLTIAGRVGLGDWRPGCKTPGPYGMFTAKIVG
jgi:hypothetical protein